ncbi:MAG: hypothetical protein ACOC6F_04045 [bacterium]
MRRRVPDISKIQQVIGWEPNKLLEDILIDVSCWADKHNGTEAEGQE